MSEKKQGKKYKMVGKVKKLKKISEKKTKSRQEIVGKFVLKKILKNIQKMSGGKKAEVKNGREKKHCQN